MNEVHERYRKHMNKRLVYEKSEAEEIETTVWRVRHSVKIPLNVKSTTNTNKLSLAKWIKFVNSMVAKNSVEKHLECGKI